MTQPSTEQMNAIASGLPTKSAKIRALDSAGFRRADIARFLGIRYQHVRNVLVQSTARPKTDQLVPVELGAGGRIVIPAACREAMGLKEGDRLIAKLEDGELRLVSKKLALSRAQKLIRRHVTPDDDLVAELIADRRKEADEDE